MTIDDQKILAFFDQLKGLGITEKQILEIVDKLETIGDDDTVKVTTELWMSLLRKGWVGTQKEIDLEQDSELKEILDKAIEICVAKEYWVDSVDGDFCLRLADYEILGFKERIELLEYLHGLVRGAELMRWLTGDGGD